MMQYRNPVILADYSDPDVIRVGGDFYMVASSFNHVPGVPVLHSKNLVEWELVNHVLPVLPFARFDRVCHGDGAWAPSLRWHDGKFFCLIPFPDEGIFVSETDDPRGTWSPLRPLLAGKGYEDPCPIWADGKCYVVFAFVKSRIGFNSRLAVFETDCALTRPADGYRFVYDGRGCNPTIEGPKFYRRGGYFYILAPAGGVSNGWQVALRSKDVYGPYESRTILVQGDTAVNGPHQGALVDLDDAGTRWAFLHFQERGPFGRVVHVQDATWADGWVRCGAPRDGEWAGQPVAGGDYPVAVRTDYAIEPNDDFTGKKLSLVWQTPANPGEGWYRLENGLRLACVPFGQRALSDLPQLFMQKICLENFTAECRCTLNLASDGDETGMVLFGEEYAYVCAVREDGRIHIELRRGTIGGTQDETLCRSQTDAGKTVTFRMTAASETDRSLAVTFACDGGTFAHPFSATPGRWTGAKIGIYARARKPSAGFATFAFFHVSPKETPMNIYQSCPSFENSRYLLRAVQDGDAEDLLRVYGDEQAVPFFNSDNCHGDDFHYTDIARMRKAIDFWQRSYRDGQFVRWTIIDKTAGTAVGTVEGFRREAQDFFTDCALLRLDLRSDYETSPAIAQILSLIAVPSFDLFGCAKAATKAVPAARERIAALTQRGFSASPEKLIGHDGTAYGDYFVLLRDDSFRQ